MANVGNGMSQVLLSLATATNDTVSAVGYGIKKTGQLVGEAVEYVHSVNVDREKVADQRQNTEKAELYREANHAYKEADKDLWEEIMLLEEAHEAWKKKNQNQVNSNLEAAINKLYAKLGYRP